MRKNVLTLRISEEIETLLIQYAKQHKWTRSFAAYEILQKFFYELSGDFR